MGLSASVYVCIGRRVMELKLKIVILWLWFTYVHMLIYTYININMYMFESRRGYIFNAGYWSICWIKCGSGCLSGGLEVVKNWNENLAFVFFFVKL